LQASQLLDPVDRVLYKFDTVSIQSARSV